LEDKIRPESRENSERRQKLTDDDETTRKSETKIREPSMDETEMTQEKENDK